MAVVVALAPGTELTAALQALLAAGIRVRTAMTPAAALGSLARLRRDFWTPNALLGTILYSPDRKLAIIDGRRWRLAVKSGAFASSTSRPAPSR